MIKRTLRRMPALPCLLALCLLFSVLCLCTACSEGDSVVTDTPAETASEVAPETVPPATEAETAGETETEAASETLPPPTAAAPEIHAGYTVAAVYREPITTSSGSAQVKLSDGLHLTVDFSSRFLGSESAVDHDTMHFGDIFRSEVINRQLPEDFRAGDLNGDRTEELLTFSDRTLTAWQVSPYTTKELICMLTQTYSFDGVLAGVGDFNADGFNDLCFYTADGRVVLSFWDEAALTFTPQDYGSLPTVTGTLAHPDRLYVGYINKDGLPDLLYADGMTLTSFSWDGTAFSPLSTFTLLDCEGYSLCAVSDINSDGLSDFGVILHTEGKRDRICTYFGRGDGRFGPTCNEEIGNRNLYPICEVGTARTVLVFGGGDVTGDGVDDYVSVMEDGRAGTTMLYRMTYPTEAPAYDYSSHVIRLEDGSYILYTGTLYSDYNTDKYNVTAGDHLIAYTSEDGEHWYPMLDGCCFPIGSELGEDGQWYSGNTMEPEVIFVDGVYYMYFQTECYTTRPDGTRVGNDHIGVATSTDGLHFTPSREPVIETDDPYFCFHHQEVMYVPDDPEGCFWMYVANAGDLGGVFLLKSNDPFHFELKSDGVLRRVSGFTVGTQVGYINDVAGGRLFVNSREIYDPTYGGGTDLKTVVGLSFSRDGIHWTPSEVWFAGVDVSDSHTAGRKNMVFSGISTYNGTGEIRPNQDGSYTLVYVACCTDRGMAPQIFYASEGVGFATLVLKTDTTD